LSSITLSTSFPKGVLARIAFADVAMDALKHEVEQLQKRDNLEKSIDDVQKTIDLLLNARKALSAGKTL
jgi:hypothetical protein